MANPTKSTPSAPNQAIVKFEAHEMEGTRPKHHVTLEEAITDLRRQITELPHDDPFFKIKGVEIELAVTTEDTVGGKVGINWIVSAGGEASSKTGAQHKIRIQLELIDPTVPVGNSGGAR